jgi:signal transduction histidine kinase
MNNLKNNEIELKLMLLLRKRSNWLILPHLTLLFFCGILLSDLRNQNGGLIPYVVVVAALGMRSITMYYFFDFILKKNFIFKCLFLSGVIATGIGWGILFKQIFEFHGLISAEGIFGVGVIITLLSGGVTTFSSSFHLGLIYILSCACIPSYFLLVDSRQFINVLGLIFLSNVVYQIYHYYFAHVYLKASLVNEEEAISQKQSLQEVIDAIPGIVILIDEEGTYRMISNYMDGYVKKLLLGKKIGSINSESPIIKFVLDFIKSDQQSAVTEMQSTDFNLHQTYMFNLKKITVPYKGIIIAVHPIQELVQARNDLKIHEARSKYASKLASLGELSAGIAHEVNNPLTIIEGAASLMKAVLHEEPLDKNSLENSANKVIATSQRIAKIIKSLRTLSGNAENEPFKNFSFYDVVEPTVEICKARLNEHNIALKVVPGHDDVALFGNEVQISQVIMNLVSNSIDAVKDLKGSRWIEICYLPSIEWLDIVIADSGPGIKDEIAGQIMEPFFSTKSLGQGTGLGLSISKSIMEYHEGSLEFLGNTPETKFRLRFPRMNPIKKNAHGK